MDRPGRTLSSCSCSSRRRAWARRCRPRQIVDVTRVPEGRRRNNHLLPHIERAAAAAPAAAGRATEKAERVGHGGHSFLALSLFFLFDFQKKREGNPVVSPRCVSQSWRAGFCSRFKYFKIPRVLQKSQNEGIHVSTDVSARQLIRLTVDLDMYNT